MCAVLFWVADVTIPNFLVQEQTAMGDGMLVTPFRVDEQGYVSIEQFSGPGEPPHPPHPKSTKNQSTALP